MASVHCKETAMGPAAILVLLVLFAASLPGQGGDFEPPCAPGNVSPAGCPSDQWTTTPGGASGMTTVFIEPDGAAIPGPTSGFPSTGSQWGIVNSGNGDGQLVPPPPSGPAPYPLAPGSTGNLVFQSVQLPPTISFEWNYVSPECPMDAAFNDFFTVDIVDPVTGTPLVNILYRDTFSPTYDPSFAVTPDETGVVPNAPGLCITREEAPLGTAKTLVFTVPIALVGSVANVEFHLGNAGDNNFSGYVYLDNISVGIAPPPIPPIYQSNSLDASLSIDGQIASGGVTPVMDLQWVRESALIDGSSVHTGQPWDVGISVDSVDSADDGAIVTAGGQIFSLDLTHPGFQWLNGLALANAFSGVSVPFSSPVPVHFGLQLAVLSPSHFDGFVLSAPNVLAVENLVGQNLTASNLDPTGLGAHQINVHGVPAPTGTLGDYEEDSEAEASTTGMMTLDTGLGAISQSISIDNTSGTLFAGGSPATSVAGVFAGTTVPPGGPATLSIMVDHPVILDVLFGDLAVGFAAKTWVTDKGCTIKTVCDGRPASPDRTQAQADAALAGIGLNGMVTQTGPATDSYNCHGFTFTCGAKWIDNPGAQTILTDMKKGNGYKCVPAGMVMVGDVVAYHGGGGNINHTGVVTMVDAGGNATEIESKWGRMPKYKHAPNKVPPIYLAPKYYRSKRGMGNKLKCKSSN